MISLNVLVKRILQYGVSIFLFWNLLVAIRAYNFTHFKTVSTNTVPMQASMFSYLSGRINGANYYKKPITLYPNSAYINVTLITTDKLNLEAWYIPTTNATGTVLIVHGYGQNKQDMLSEARGFEKMGYNALLIDCRGHGNSQGNTSTLGLTESKDVLTAYNYIKQKGEKNIILYGASMGAAAISHCVSKYGITPTKVVLDMPFANYEQLSEYFIKRGKYPSRPTASLFTFWSSVMNQQWFYSIKPSEYVKTLKCPTLLQWGVHDDLVPESATKLIYANITSDKTLQVYANSAHENFSVCEPLVWQSTVSKFMMQ